MRKLAFISFIAALFMPAIAYADSVEGLITTIDSSTNTLELSDGYTYKLPGEFDYTVIHEGMKVLVFYDNDGPNRYVTDIEPENDNGVPFDNGDHANDNTGSDTRWGDLAPGQF